MYLNKVILLQIPSTIVYFSVSRSAYRVCTVLKLAARQMFIICINRRSNSPASTSYTHTHTNLDTIDYGHVPKFSMYLAYSYVRLCLCMCVCVCVHDDSLSSNIKKSTARAAAKINKAKRAHIGTHTVAQRYHLQAHRHSPTHTHTVIEYIHFSFFLC